MTAHQLTVSKTARYYLLGKPGPHIKQVWFVCHGYGQLAEYFVRKFQALDNGETLVVAPEGLSHFYLEGTSGRVGATWMTRVDRLAEIADYTQYLNTLAGYVLPQLPEQVKVYVLGFSQGAATVCRWLASGRVSCRALVLWAGVFPPDLNAEAAFAALQKTRVLLAAGTTDAYLTEQAANQQLQQLQKLALHAELHWFNGGHEINTALLMELDRKLSAEN